MQAVRPFFGALERLVRIVIDLDNDDDVEFVGRKGANPLADWSHARHDCAVHPFPRDRT